MKRFAWLAGLALLGMTPSHLTGQDASTIDRVEEDWELVISQPEPDEESPQILNVIAPGGSTNSDFYVFEINHNTQPEYSAGGLELQRWTGNAVQSWSAFPDTSPLSTPNETITYTLRMKLYGGVLAVSVRNGQSVTWGDFGPDNLRIWSFTTLTNLNNYSTDNSVANSRIGYASYRVTRFALKEVRYYSGSVLVKTDTTDRVVHEYEP
jgi:hypothetical protein